MKKILVVDDAATVRLGIRQKLETDGFSVVEAAETAARHLPFMQSNIIDCLVTDLNMPVMNGLELVEKNAFIAGVSIHSDCHADLGKEIRLLYHR